MHVPKHALYFSIYYVYNCLMPDDVSHQWKSIASKHVNKPICQCLILTQYLTGNVFKFI